jgi:hypothetical protein
MPSYSKVYLALNSMRVRICMCPNLCKLAYMQCDVSSDSWSCRESEGSRKRDRGIPSHHSLMYHTLRLAQFNGIPCPTCSTYRSLCSHVLHAALYHSSLLSLWACSLKAGNTSSSRCTRAMALSALHIGSGSSISNHRNKASENVLVYVVCVFPTHFVMLARPSSTELSSSPFY